MKKVLSALIVAVMLIGMLPMISIPASAATYGDLTYEIENGEATITDCDKSATGSLEIPATLDGCPVTTIGNDAFGGRSGLTSVTIPDSVTSIGIYAFDGCTGLTSVTIPDSVIFIGNSAFEECAGLTSVTIGDSVTSIGGWAFCDCTGLISVTIGDSVKTIGEYAFSGCTGLTSITIPNRVTTIDEGAFRGCGLTSVTIPDSVKTIGEYAFSGCTGLTSISIDNTVTTINEDAFDNTGYYNNVSNWEDDVLYLGNYLIEAREEFSGSYSIKTGTKLIAGAAFGGCTGLISITIPDSVTSIGRIAFSGCTGLTSVTIPDSVTTIGRDAFSCTGLTSVVIPDGVITIGVCAFSSCAGLTSIAIPDSVTSIDDWTFEDCTRLASITIPDSVTIIGYGAFNYCSALKDVWYTGTEEQKSQMEILTENEALENATWHYNSCTIGAPHTYDNACDKDCNICKATRTPAAHKGGTATCKEKAKCSVCGVTYGNLADHKFGGYVYNEDATSQADGTKTRTCSVCQKTEIVTATGTKLQNPFKDVKANEYYTEPVLWAVGKKITNGMSANSFAPNNDCTRGQIVTFLWRAAGSPEPTSTKNPFKDVKSNQYYYKAVLWAVEKGITNGTSSNTFSPDATCTRAQVVTFLWRAKGSPKVSATNPFKDVKKSYYSDAVLWAVKNNITTGISATQFAPDNTCTRGQIVTFLYRAYK